MRLFYAFIRTFTGFVCIPVCIFLAWEKIDKVVILQSLKHELFYLLLLGVVSGAVLMFSLKGLSRLALYTWRRWKAEREKRNKAREAEQVVRELRAI